jgi:tungstate transport system ATP-binding protein
MANGTMPLRVESVCYDAAGRRLIDALSLSLGSGPRTVILGPNEKCQIRL